MYLPKQYNYDGAFIRRLLGTRSRSAYEAMAHAAFGIVLSRIDRRWEKYELKRYARFAAPRKPIIIVIGPPRSGTTLLAQAVVAATHSAYFNNLTAIFPRSPIEANARLRWLLKAPTIDFRFYYGKTAGLNGFNDGLYLWDRWLGNDRGAIPNRLMNNDVNEINQFFAAFQNFYDKPVTCKINRLDCCAHLVANALAEAKFICLQRAPVNLANSLYRARKEIAGTLETPYGTDFNRYVNASTKDPVKNVAAQVRFHIRQAQEQHDLIGPDRFRFIRYEDFCRTPRETIQSIAHWGLGAEPSGLRLEVLPTRFNISQISRDASPFIDDLIEELVVESNDYHSQFVHRG